MKRMLGGSGPDAAGISRRRLLAGAGAVSRDDRRRLSSDPDPRCGRRSRSAPTVATFKDSFDEHIYPAFTEETGIEIELIAEPTGEAWLVQLETAARANVAPADVSMMAQVTRIKGQNAKLWAPLDETKLPNAKNLQPHFVQRYPDGKISAIGAVSWYVTLVTNTEVYPEPPTSWKALWDPANADRLGLLALVSNSFLLEITATTWFDGDRDPGHGGGHPRGAGQARRGQAERPALVSRRGPVPAGAAVRRDPDGPVLPRRHGSRGGRGSTRALDLPTRGRGAQLGLLVCVQGLAGSGGGARLHRLHVPSRDPGRAVAQGRHGADRSDATCSTSRTRSSPRSRATSRRSSRATTCTPSATTGSIRSGPR